MSDFIWGNEASIRISYFDSVLSLMALWEILASRRPQPSNDESAGHITDPSSIRSKYFTQILRY